MSAPFLYRAYVTATAAAVPLAAYLETKKLRQAGVEIHRAHEKLGHATLERRGAGPLIWFHAASVGESVSVLSLITRMGQSLPRAHFLITSGTATSAQIVAKRMPPRCVHQFAPLDAPGPIKRFLKHWRPDAAIFVESELWPQMLRRTHASGARMALLNARLSERSVARWARRPVESRYVLEVFDLILTQNDKMAEAMVAMHAPADRVARGSNLKALSAPLAIDESALNAARDALGSRPLWVASSTHAGEEETALAAHKILLKRWPDLHLILAPRHPARGDAVAQLIADAGLCATRRSKGDAPGEQVYLADTLGELGTWYALSDIVFLGGSLLPIGGHNPFEVAQAGAAVLSGPYVTNFAETFAAMQTADAVQIVANTKELSSALNDLLGDTKKRMKMQTASTEFAHAGSDALDRIAERLIKILQLTP